MKTIFRLAVAIAVMIQSQTFGQSESMVKIEGGSYLPLYGTEQEVVVGDFLMDVTPVTNQDFLEFLQENPQWKKSQVRPLFADSNYLATWPSDDSYGANLPSAPVTMISWYAAKNYCEWLEMRLPTIDEWEYVAMASATRPDGRQEAGFQKTILGLYEAPNTYKNEVGTTFRNYWGVEDLHGLVWEWTMDFNSIMIGGESRKDSAGGGNLFCAGAAVGASDVKDYAAFMRYTFRGSVKAKYAVKNLGFRCVKDLPADQNKN